MKWLAALLLAGAVDQPRASGYFVGDLLTQRVRLESATPTPLPAPGRVSAWFDRRRATVATDSSGHRWLVIEYQILNAPPKLVTVTLPAWQLHVKERTAPVIVPAARINIAPLSPPGTPLQVGTADLRPDRLAPLIPIVPIQRVVAMSSGALILTLIAWLGWVLWRNQRDAARQPFARALREMRGLDDHTPQLWQALHRAFDRTAGSVIQSATLPVLFTRAPQLTPVRAEIERFYAASDQHFFAGAGQGASDDAIGDRSSTATPFSPRALCEELRRLEKRHS